MPGHPGFDAVNMPASLLVFLGFGGPGGSRTPHTDSPKAGRPAGEGETGLDHASLGPTVQRLLQAGLASSIQ